MKYEYKPHEDITKAVIQKRITLFNLRSPGAGSFSGTEHPRPRLPARANFFKMEIEGGWIFWDDPLD